MEAWKPGYMETVGPVSSGRWRLGKFHFSLAPGLRDTGGHGNPETGEQVYVLGPDYRFRDCRLSECAVESTQVGRENWKQGGQEAGRQTEDGEFNDFGHAYMETGERG